MEILEELTSRRLGRLTVRQFCEVCMGNRQYSNRLIIGCASNGKATHEFINNFTQCLHKVKIGGRATEQNIQPGLVLDSSVTHHACEHDASKQFILNHTTLQGTAKTPLYMILADNCNASMDRLEELTYTLCHHHQIIALTTSVPTPLYVANEYAKRGRALCTEKNDHNPLEDTTGSKRNLLKNKQNRLPSIAI